MATTYNEDGSTSKSIAERQTAKKPKSRQGVYQRNDKKYEVPSTDVSDVYYGEVASRHVNEHNADAARRNR